ncbi:MAG: hypothetical protein ACK4NR_06180 [Micavibrio sp.]
MSESDPDKDAVEVFHRINRLKLKTGANVHDGPGFIDLHAVKRAQGIIEKKQSIYPKVVKESLQNLTEAWESFKKTEDQEERRQYAERIYHTANHIKDLAATFDYGLMQHFALSLRDFAERIDVNRPQHLVIVQAHCDVMNVVYSENIKDQGGEKAAELKMIVAKAVEKYS